jgi:pilus assembly protein CpaF
VTAPARGSPAPRGGPLDAATAARLLREELGVSSTGELFAALRRLDDDLSGLGPLQPLADRPDVTDVLVNGPDEVWIDAARGLERVEAPFVDAAAVVRLAVRLAGAAGRRLDLSAPMTDVPLPGGHRLHAVLPPISPVPLLSLRMARGAAASLDWLVRAAAVPPAGAELLAGLVAARVSLVVSGGTGSGKTTVLGALLSELDATERVVLVEDPPEVRTGCPHVVSLAPRPANSEGAGAVGLRELVRHALRMRPSRLVLGEVRGAEVVDLLVALNTGHAGGMTTVHANRAGEVPARMEALAALAGLSRRAAHSLLAAAVRVVVHLDRDASGHRGVREIGVLSCTESGLVGVTSAAVFEAGRVHRGAGAAALDRLLAGSPGTPGP